MLTQKIGEAYKKFQAEKKKFSNEKMALLFNREICRISTNSELYFYELYKHFLLDSSIARKTGIKVKREDVVKDMVDMTLFSWFMEYARKSWIPQQGAGSQTEGYEEHRVLSEWVFKFCKNKKSH